MNKCFSALCITVCLSCVACESNETNVSKYTTEELLEYSETNKVLVERQNILEEITNEPFSRSTT